jgi:hypothetical protein
MKKRLMQRRLLIALMLLSAFPALAQHANDTLCFTMYLSIDENSLFGCGSGDDMKTVLSGPVIMEGKSLLFYSCNGYALYSQSGALLDSSSVFQENKRFAKDDPRRLVLAYPLDRSTILYYRKSPDKDNKSGIEVLQKKLYKKGYVKVDPVQAALFKDIQTAQLFNLCNNCITDDMAAKLFIQPNLVGYTSLTGGERWWSLDRFYSFTSPLIVEKNGICVSFFSGLLHDQKTDVQKHLINPLGTYSMDGQWYYYGVHTTLGGQDPESYQRLYLCDQAGNMLYSNEILKQIIVDAVLEYDKKNNTNFTVKRPSQFVFTPAVDNNGDIFYGIIDYHKRTIDVKKCLFFRYVPHIVPQENENIVNAQRRFTFNPVVLDCPDERAKKILPDIVYRDEKGKKRKAFAREITVKGYCAKIGREPNKDLKKKISQISSTLPAPVKHMKDSLEHIGTSWCPYTLVLDQEGKGTVASFYYGCGNEVLSARVLNVTETFEVFVRVDLLDWAEVVVFSLDGSFLNRFTFNRRPFLDRKDIVAVTADRRVIEEDYERIAEDYTIYSWDLSVQAPIQ